MTPVQKQALARHADTLQASADRLDATLTIPSTKKTRKPRVPRATKVDTTPIQQPLTTQPSAVSRYWHTLMQFMLAVRHVSIGAALAFLSHLPSFFDPILFVAHHAGILTRAAVHLFAPVTLSFLALYQVPALQPILLGQQPLYMQLFAVASLYAMSAMVWMSGWVFAGAAFRGATNMMKQFESIGRSQKTL